MNYYSESTLSTDYCFCRLTPFVDGKDFMTANLGS